MIYTKSARCSTAPQQIIGGECHDVEKLDDGRDWCMVCNIRLGSKPHALFDVSVDCHYFGWTGNYRQPVAIVR